MREDKMANCPGKAPAHHCCTNRLSRQILPFVKIKTNNYSCEEIRINCFRVELILLDDRSFRDSETHCSVNSEIVERQKCIWLRVQRGILIKTLSNSGGLFLKSRLITLNCTFNLCELGIYCIFHYIPRLFEWVKKAEK